MQFQQLRYFLAVAETRHFTRAARVVNVSQPTLSQQIRALESELGAPLMNRVRGNITLTEAGTALLPLARRMLTDAETARQDVAEITHLRGGRVRLGATPSLCTAILPPVLVDFRRRYPKVQIQLQESGSQDLAREVVAGNLDLALIVLPLRRGDTALTARPLLQESLVVAFSASLPPLVEAQALHLADLRELPLVMFRRGYMLREVVERACARLGFEPRLAVEGGEMDTVLGLVEAGLGAAVLPSTVAQRPGLRSVPFIPLGMQRTVALARRRDVSMPRAAARMATEVESYLRRAHAAGELPAGVGLAAPR